MKPPIIVTGAPRSGTSLTMQILHAAGMQLGKSAEESLNAAPGSPRGEGRIREQIEKPILERGGFDPLGQNPLPPLEWKPDFITASELREQVLAAVQVKDLNKPWGFKAIKGLLFWPLFAEAFPDAQWVFVERQVNEHIKSIMRTPFMRAFSTEEEWRKYLSKIDSHMNACWDGVDNVSIFHPENVREGRYNYVAELVHGLGLEMTEAVYEQYNPKLYRA